LVGREPQLLAEVQQVSAVGIGDANALPALAGAHQGRVDQLQAAPLVEEARDDLGAPALFLEAPLDEVRIWYENGGATSAVSCSSIAALLW